MTTDRCRAKGGRASCPKHGNPQQQLFMRDMGFVVSQPSKPAVPVITNSLVSRAVDSPLIWGGAKPEWWDGYRSELLSHPDAPSEPQLVDVVDSPVGPLAVVWQDECYDRGELSMSFDSAIGMQVCYFKSVQTGATLGYIRVASMTDETIERSFGDDEFTAFRFRSRFGGTRYPFQDEPDGSGAPGLRGGQRNLSGDALVQKRREVWLTAHQDLGLPVRDADGSVVPAYMVSEKHVPSDDEVKRSLADISVTLKAEMDAKRAYHGTPYISYSKVEDPLKGQGFGSALYVYTARMLGRQGKVMRASMNQQPAAVEAWKRFQKAFPKRSGSMSIVNNDESIRVATLDFRG